MNDEPNLFIEIATGLGIFTAIYATLFILFATVPQ